MNGGAINILLGALFIDDKIVKAELINCTFAYNCAIPIPPVNTFSFGGALSTASPTSITSCSFINNFATSNGGAIFGALNPSPPRPIILTNCLFFNNTISSSAQQPVNRSLLEGGGNVQFPDSTIKITANVKVLEPKLNIPQIEGIQYRVPHLPNSPCLDAGVCVYPSSPS